MQAHIGGIVSMSTVDWPKNICTVIFFAGCDFKCPYCQNSELIRPHEDHKRDIKDVKKELKDRQRKAEEDAKLDPYESNKKKQKTTEDEPDDIN